MLLARKIGIKNGISILEIGSGAGREALWFATFGVTFVSLEIDFESCISIRKRLKRARRRNADITVIRADAQHLPLKDDLFDAVFCKAFLHHISKPFQSILEMYRVSKENGIVAAIDEPNALNPLWHVARFLVHHLHLKSDFLGAPEFLGQATSFHKWQLKEYFEKANFQSIEDKPVWLPYITYSKLYFKIWVLLERLMEKILIPYVFGQLFILGRK